MNLPSSQVRPILTHWSEGAKATPCPPLGPLLVWLGFPEEGGPVHQPSQAVHWWWSSKAGSWCCAQGQAQPTRSLGIKRSSDPCFRNTLPAGVRGTRWRSVRR